MLIGRLQKLTTPTKAETRVVFWFALSLTFSAIYSFEAIRQAFEGNYVVQDDARQHIFWMQRFLDAELFPGDLIADYFQSVAPLGYSTFYWLFASVGIDPNILSKFLPLVLGLISTGYCFGICLQLLRVPNAGFISALLLNQNLWMRDDLVSATPAAFVYPLFLSFLYYLLRGSLLPYLMAIALLGLFYPQCVLIAAGIMLLRWRREKVRLGLGLGVVLLILLPYALQESEFGSVITVDQARELFAFSADGWSKFFDGDWWNYWICGKRSGILPPEWCRIIRKYSILLLPPQIWMSLLLPILLRYPDRFPLAKRVEKISILPQMLLASLGMFAIAHLALFKLHLPNRYTEHSLRIIVALAGGVAFTIVLDALLRQRRRAIAISGTVLLGTALILYPSLLQANDYPFPVTQYTVGKEPQLYQFFEAQPQDTLVASIAEEVNNLPSFAHRSILVGGEGYTLAYHVGYYHQIYDRTVELIQAQYSQDLLAVQEFIDHYGVDFWLLERTAFTPDYLINNRWISQYPDAGNEALNALKEAVPALATLQNRCSVFQTDNLIVLEANCISNS